MKLPVSELGIDAGDADGFLAYAVRACTRAVRADDDRLLQLAAQATLVAQPVSDYREVLRRLAVIADASERFGVNLDDLVDRFRPQWADERLARFASYDETHPRPRSLTDMGFRWDTSSAGTPVYRDVIVETFDDTAFADKLQRAGAPAAVVERIRERGRRPSS